MSVAIALLMILQLELLHELDTLIDLVRVELDEIESAPCLWGRRLIGKVYEFR